MLGLKLNHVSKRGHSTNCHTNSFPELAHFGQGLVVTCRLLVMCPFFLYILNFLGCFPTNARGLSLGFGYSTYYIGNFVASTLPHLVSNCRVSLDLWKWFYMFCLVTTLITRFMGPTRGPPGDDRTQVGPMLAIWNLLSGYIRRSIFFKVVALTLG